jgi:hypothetical protein
MCAVCVESTGIERQIWGSLRLDLEKHKSWHKPLGSRGELDADKSDDDEFESSPKKNFGLLDEAFDDTIF